MRNAFFVLCSGFLTFLFFSSALAQSPQADCETQRFDKRKEVMDQLGISSLFALHEQVLLKLTDEDKAALAGSAKTKGKLGDKAFKEQGTKILSRDGGVFNSHIFKLTDVDDTTVVGRFQEADNVRQAILFSNPNIQIGRKLLGSGKDSTQITPIILDNFGLQPIGETLVIQVTGHGKDNRYLLSEYVEQKLVRECKGRKYPESFDSFLPNEVIRSSGEKPVSPSSDPRGSE